MVFTVDQDHPVPVPARYLVSFLAEELLWWQHGRGLVPNITGLIRLVRAHASTVTPDSQITAAVVKISAKKMQNLTLSTSEDLWSPS